MKLSLSIYERSILDSLKWNFSSLEKYGVAACSSSWFLSIYNGLIEYFLGLIWLF